MKQMKENKEGRKPESLSFLCPFCGEEVFFDDRAGILTIKGKGFDPFYLFFHYDCWKAKVEKDFVSLVWNRTVDSLKTKDRKVLIIEK